MIFADLALARRLELNDALNIADYARTLRQLQPTSLARVLPVAGAYAAFTQANFPVNRTVGLGLTQPVTHDDLDEIEALYRSCGVPSKLDVCPLADRSLLDEVGRRGYRITSFFNTHIRPIMPADALVSPHTHIQVAPVAPADGELWAQTMARSALADDAVAANDMGLALARIAFQRTGVTCFLAWLDNKPVGAAGLMIRDGLATFFSTTTRVAYRNQGVQMALIQARFAHAAMAGCDLVTVVTVPGAPSQRNMQRAGFQIVYTRLVMQRELA